MKRKKKILVMGIILIGLVLWDQSFWFRLTDSKKENLRNEASVFVRQSGKAIPEKPFTTDGCSVWPNKIPFVVDWTNECIKHDMFYWSGTSSEERNVADQEIRESINKKPLGLGTFMYLGIRVGGHECLPFPWRFGYGNSYAKSCSLFN